MFMVHVFYQILYGWVEIWVIVISAGIFMCSSKLSSSLDFRGSLFTRALIRVASLCKHLFQISNMQCSHIWKRDKYFFFSSCDVLSRLCELNRRPSILHLCFDTNCEEADYIEISIFFNHL
jgi:hypothetical protein